MKPTVLAVIPARANSKRIPGKNKKLFLGKPLIYWSIQAALDSTCVTDVVVSTDDEEILAFSKNFPKVKFLSRPKELALDGTPGVDPILHLMGHLGRSYEFVVLLQPTSPLRTGLHVDEAFEMLLKSAKQQIVSVKNIVDTFGHIVFKSGDGVQFIKKMWTDLPDDKDLKVLNGAIYISEWKTLLAEKTFIGRSVSLFEMLEVDSVDIDFPEDWERAERYARMKVK
jgi:CMP-N-acetylneuraminic acid synthetase